MAPARRVTQQRTRVTPPTRGGIRRSRRVRRVALPAEDPDTIHVRVEGRESPDSSLSSSITLTQGTLDNASETGDDPAFGPTQLRTLENMLERREDLLVGRIVAQLTSHNNDPDFHPEHTHAAHPQPLNQPIRRESETGNRIPDVHGMYTPPPPICHDESASATLDLVEALFPGVERATLTQIIENRFKPTNIYRLLASEKDRAESQRVISIGGVSFEQGKREGKESEYRMGPFFKAWMAYCGILTKLAPAGLQGDLACSLYIYSQNLHDLLEQ